MGSAKMGQVGYSVSRNTISYQQNQAKNMIMRSYGLIEKYFLKPLGQFTIIAEAAAALRKPSNEVL